MHALKSSNEKISNPEIITKTDGADIEVTKIKFKMFDLAGDDNYLETHAMFLSENALYLAVFNKQLSEIYSKDHDVITRIEMWLSSIYARAKTARVIIVATHVDTPIASKQLLEEIWNKLDTNFIKSKEKYKADFRTNSLEKYFTCYNGDLKRQRKGKVVSVNSNTDFKSLDETFDDCSVSRSFPHVFGYFEVGSVKQIPWKWYSLQNESIGQLKYQLIPYQLPIGKPTDHAWPLAHRENQVNVVFQEFFSYIMAAIERSYYRQNYRQY